MPLPAFFVGRWLLAEQPEIRMQLFAFVNLLQWTLNWTPWNFLWFLLELDKMPRLIHDTHGPCTQRFEHMSQPSTERNSTMPLPAFFVGRWLFAEQPEIRLQWFAFVSLLQWTLNWTPWNFLGFLLELEKCHASFMTPTAHVHRDLSTTFHVTTQHWEKQHHAVTSLFCRSLVACWTARNTDAVVCFCQPSSVEIELNAVKLPWVFVGASNASQTFEQHVPCHNTTPWKQHTRLQTISGSKNRALAACCVWETLNQRVKAGGPWTHRWHGPTKTHLCRRENVPAKLSSSEMARWPSQKPPMPTCHDRTRHANVTTWHDMYHFISCHPLPSGVLKVCVCV